MKLHWGLMPLLSLPSSQMWFFGRRGASGFSASSTADEVTLGIDASALTAIVTGASSGIGSEATRVLALRGVHVIMAVRNMAAAKEVKQAIVKELPSAKLDAMELDLSSMTSVRKFASDFNSSGQPLNLLMNYGNPLHAFQRQHRNAVCNKPPRPFSFDKSIVGYHEKTARKSGKEGRIVNLSSEAHRMSYCEGIRFDGINDQSGYTNMGAYGHSKLANILHANKLTRHLKEDGVNITANSLHPGVIATNLFRHSGFSKGFVGIFAKYVLNVQQGAVTTCYVALHPQVKGISGEYFANSNLSKPN